MTGPLGFDLSQHPLTVFRAIPNSRAIFRIEEPARQRLMISLRFWPWSWVWSSSIKSSRKSGHVVRIASQPGKGRRQHQTIAGRQAGAADTL